MRPPPPLCLKLALLRSVCISYCWGNLDPSPSCLPSPGLSILPPRGPCPTLEGGLPLSQLFSRTLPRASSLGQGFLLAVTRDRPRCATERLVELCCPPSASPKRREGGSGISRDEGWHRSRSRAGCQGGQAVITVCGECCRSCTGGCSVTGATTSGFSTDQ